MKTVDISEGSQEMNELLAQAEREDLIIRTADGREFVLTAVDEFDREVALARQNETLMDFLELRAKQTRTIPLADVKEQLGLDE